MRATAWHSPPAAPPLFTQLAQLSSRCWSSRASFRGLHVLCLHHLLPRAELRPGHSWRCLTCCSQPLLRAQRAVCGALVTDGLSAHGLWSYSCTGLCPQRPHGLVLSVSFHKNSVWHQELPCVTIWIIRSHLKVIPRYHDICLRVAG